MNANDSCSNLPFGHISSNEFFDFVSQNAHEDVSRLRLKYHRPNYIAWYRDAIVQIECRQRFKAKLENILENYPQFLFPDILAGEQSTSELFAKYHTKVVGATESVCDMTAGLGIDALNIASRGIDVLAYEINKHRAETLKYNAQVMGVDNHFEVRCGDSVKALERGELSAETLFIDPARRDNVGARVFAISDCQPDLIAIEPLVTQHFKRMVAKLSPMLDVTAITHSLNGLSDLYILGTTTECRELITVSYPSISKKDKDKTPRIHAVTLSADRVDKYSFRLEDEYNATVSYGVPSIGNILVLPYPSIVKAGAFRLFAQNNSLTKIAPNTHVYYTTKETILSTESLHNIQGQLLEIIDIIEGNSKNIKLLKKKYPEAWVTCKNFGMSSAELQKRLTIKAHGNYRIIAVSDASGYRHLIITQTFNY